MPHRRHHLDLKYTDTLRSLPRIKTIMKLYHPLQKRNQKNQLRHLPKSGVQGEVTGASSVFFIRLGGVTKLTEDFRKALDLKSKQQNTPCT